MTEKSDAKFYDWICVDTSTFPKKQAIKTRGEAKTHNVIEPLSRYRV